MTTFDEHQHPRANDGKFSHTAGSGSTPKPKLTLSGLAGALPPKPGSPPKQRRSREGRGLAPPKPDTRSSTTAPAVSTPKPPASAPPKSNQRLSLAGLHGAIPARHGGAILTPEAYNALNPAPRRSDQLRDRTLAAFGDDPEAKLLADTLARWQDGGGVKSFRHKVDAYVNGDTVDKTSERRAKAMLNAIRHTPPEMVPQSLHRGLAIPGSADTVLAQYKAGSKVNLNLTSFSTNKGVAREFASESAKGKARKTKVVMEVVGTTKALPIQNVSQNNRFFQEREYITAGRFEIVSATKTPDGTVVLKMRQVAPL